MKFLYLEIKKVFKYSDPLLLLGIGTFLVGGIWFLYFGISGLLR